MENDVIQKVAADIAANHRKIIDDWCKAYLAQLYEEGIEIKPECFTLNEQWTQGFVKRYWFTIGIPEFKE